MNKQNKQPKVPAVKPPSLTQEAEHYDCFLYNTHTDEREAIQSTNFGFTQESSKGKYLEESWEGFKF